MICNLRSDHNLDHLQVWTTWELWTLRYKKARVSDEKARKSTQNEAKNRCFCVWDVDAAGSNPVTPTRKSLWSSTPHRDFSIECYKVAKKTPDGIDYEITIDGKNGYATVAMTKYYDGTEEPTLPINLGTHSIYFYAE